jgi:hypothetical protein
MEFMTWALKALLWVFSAVILTITLKRSKGSPTVEGQLSAHSMRPFT